MQDARHPAALETSIMATDVTKLNAFMGNFIHDQGKVRHATAIAVGDQRGLCKVLAAAPSPAEALAGKIGADARYIREWLLPQAAGGNGALFIPFCRFSLAPFALGQSTNSPGAYV